MLWSESRKSTVFRIGKKEEKFHTFSSYGFLTVLEKKCIRTTIPLVWRKVKLQCTRKWTVEVNEQENQPLKVCQLLAWTVNIHKIYQKRAFDTFVIFGGPSVNFEQVSVSNEMRMVWWQNSKIRRNACFKNKATRQSSRRQWTFIIIGYLTLFPWMLCATFNGWKRRNLNSPSIEKMKMTSQSPHNRLLRSATSLALTMEKCT